MMRLYWLIMCIRKLFKFILRIYAMFTMEDGRPLRSSPASSAMILERFEQLL